MTLGNPLGIKNCSFYCSQGESLIGNENVEHETKNLFENNSTTCRVSCIHTYIDIYIGPTQPH